MGLFDSVWVSCPACDAPGEFQSKGSEDRFLRSFAPDTAPNDVLVGAEGAQRCKCGQWIALQVDQTVEHEVFPIEQPDSAWYQEANDMWFVSSGFDVRQAVRSPQRDGDGDG